MELGERKRKILQAIIDDYICTAEPVGSRTIAKKHELGLSSATIRNEMADLEDMGFLAQPHTSAGRIPSDLGYRLYVDQLMRRYKLTIDEINSIKYAMELKIQELNDLIQQASYAISKLTQYTTIVSTPQMKKSSIKHLQLVPIDSVTALLVLVTNASVVKNKTIKLDCAVDIDFLNKLSSILNEKLGGLTIEQITLQKIQEIRKEMGYNEEMLMPILDHISESINSIDNAEVFLGGTTNIFNFPEYNDIERAKEFFGFIEEKKSLYKLLNGMLQTKGVQPSKNINIVIGRENEFIEMKDCSIVTSSYSIGDKIVGVIGIIGPTRMEYAKTISSLEYMTDSFNRMLMRLFNEGKSD
ncbi:heat-inducible transcriptional repressor HrcA [Petroclostridium sp. X23]|uniref:heat-inducible transcriptional repressor HrcA n=1 Tax=Petroclostridium sp. X23 TaxID=3045146 RepID=UPI0024AE8655|nr:heat-inducible transcriptional repressor HrcA [Petroclostridium sp. X23]WHH60429.1 heat-inducible transcriptional repressor HrcA [Petroclostridium sp. X23]